jgi:hypothetical protein
VGGCFAAVASRSRGIARLPRARARHVGDPADERRVWRSKRRVLSEVWVVASPRSRRAHEGSRGCRELVLVTTAIRPVNAAFGEASGGSCRKCGWLLRRGRVALTRDRAVATSERSSRRRSGRRTPRLAKQAEGLVGSVGGCFAAVASRSRGIAQLPRARARHGGDPADERRVWRSKRRVLSEVWVVASPACRGVDHGSDVAAVAGVAVVIRVRRGGVLARRGGSQQADEPSRVEKRSASEARRESAS